MAKHMMVDLETMAVSPNAVVLTLGAVHFNPYGTGYSDKIYFRINIDDQDALNREVDPGTLDWWTIFYRAKTRNDGRRITSRHN